jgi:hypothetical protein
MNPTTTLLFAAVTIGAAAFAAEFRPATGDSIQVTINGTLRTGIMAIGAETTGTTITANGITWELDFGKHERWRKLAEKLDGQRVLVHGSLERRAGVEIKERWIVTVEKFSAAEKT